MSHRPSVKTFLLLAVLGFFAWFGLLCFGIKQTGLPWGASLEKLGLFGDMFGCINALFSAFAMCGAVYALIVQTWQISDQKKHDHDMLRREKLEKLVHKFSEMRQRMDLLLLDLDSVNHVSIQPQESRRIKVALREIQLVDMEAALLAALYFQSSPQVMLKRDESFFPSVYVPLEKYLNEQDREKACDHFSEYAKLSGQYFAACGECLKFIVGNREKILAGEIG